MDSCGRLSGFLTFDAKCQERRGPNCRPGGSRTIIAAMSDALITKKALAAALKELMRATPLAKVSVQQVVDACGLQRQTFYYHFQDKYELVNWIYQTEAVEGIAGFRDYRTWTEGIRRVFRYLADNQDFYVNALNTPGQNSFDGFLFEATRELNLNVVRELSASMKVRAADQDFIADFYTFAFVGLAVRWVKSGMRESPEDLTRRISDIVEGSMQRALAKQAQARPARLLQRSPD
jgi:probable dihydroxyacetone kinase regulator